MSEIILSKSIGGVNNTELTEWNVNIESLVKELNSPTIGDKDGSYYLRCVGTYRNNADTSDIAHVLILDGDSRINEDGEIVSGAPDPELVHKFLTKLGMSHFIYSSHSNGATGADYHKYRVIIPCVYSPEQLPVLLDVMFEQLHKAGVMLAPVKENKAWSQAWYFPRVPDAERLALFKFYHHEGKSLNADKAVVAWLRLHPKVEPVDPTYKPYVAQPNENLKGWLNPIKEFNQTFSIHDVLIRNGYIQKGKKYLRPGSESKIPAVQLCLSCKDGVERVFSHGGDALNDGYAHDAFDCMRLLECGGVW
jgi:hypothetical protein